jgi:hypothetical protein
MARRVLRVALIAFASFGYFGFASDTNTGSSTISAATIANRNAAARGGLAAWGAVQTLVESGKLTAGGDQRTAQPGEIPGAKRPTSVQPIPSSPRLKEEAQLPFVMEMARQRRVRFELEFKGKKAVQVYDGVNGWKLRPYLNRLEVEPYSADELRLASMQSDLDGPLMNYAAKGTLIELVGKEKVEDRDTYKLKLTAKDGHVMHVWIDAETFLEAKVEGQPRRLDGNEHPVEVYYRDYRNVSGMQFPFLLETRVLPVENRSGRSAGPSYPAEKIMIEKIVINPKLDESHFSKPQIQQAESH